MNQNNYINQNKINYQIPHPKNCFGCYNCAKIECNCSCHLHKNISPIYNKKIILKKMRKIIVKKRIQMSLIIMIIMMKIYVKILEQKF